MQDKDKFTIKEKVAVLLAEYNTLRQEVMAARANLGQAIGIFSAAMMTNLTLALGFAKDSATPWIVMIFGVLYFLFLWIWNEKNTDSFTRRLRELEREINSVAGEPLMLWETIHGWGKIFWKTNPNFREETYARPEAPLDSGLMEALLKKTG